MCVEKNNLVARAVAPEDVRPGDYIIPLHVVNEYRPLPWQCDNAWQAQTVRRLELPATGAPPVHVLEVCLPLLLVRMPQGKHRLIDVRRFRLARVSEQFGQRVFERFAADKAAEQKTEPRTDAAKTE